MIVLAGENIVDAFCQKNGKTRAVAGGSPLNVACAAAKLGARAAYFTPISADADGDLLLAALKKAGAEYALPRRSKKPSSRAEISLTKSGDAIYRFRRKGAADNAFNFSDLPPLPPQSALLQIGGSLAIDGGASRAFAALAFSAAKRGVPLCIDPNIREMEVKNAPRCRRRIAALFAAANIIKLSEEDAHFLFGKESAEKTARRLLKNNTAQMWLTRGENGASVFQKRRGEKGEVTQAHCRARRVKVVDTVGAGDCFAAGLWARMSRRGLLEKAAAGAMTKAQLQDALRFAAATAALNCTGKGCSPPTWRRVEAFIKTKTVAE